MPYREPDLDRVFQALSDGTRRAIVARLVRGPASVKQLSEPFAMSLPSVMQHLQVLESCGLVSSEKAGRVRTCRIDTGMLRAAENWLAGQRTIWESRLDRLGEVLTQAPEAPSSDTASGTASSGSAQPRRTSRSRSHITEKEK